MTAAKNSTHAAVWAAIDATAAKTGLALSTLSQRAFGHPTAFDNYHRQRDGKPTWPTMRTVSKLLDVTGTDFAEFGTLVEAKRQQIEEAQHGR